MQRAIPLFIDSLADSGSAQALERLPPSKREELSEGHSEEGLQELIHRLPEVHTRQSLAPGAATSSPDLGRSDSATTPNNRHRPLRRAMQARRPKPTPLQV
jgi:hypothetical protein